MTQPLTRDLNETIRALEISEAETLFQAERLAHRVVAGTEQEIEHLSDLQDGYTDAARYLRILINYHRGRLVRNERRRDGDDSIDSKGRASAVTEG